MGGCVSSKPTSSVPAATAKLILMDGTIKEFSEEVGNREILGEYPGHFICNSDGLYVGQNISQVLGDDDQLQVGQLYFLLPQRKLQFALTAPDMASLLFRVSTALSAQKNRATKRQKRSKFSCGFGKAQAQVQPIFDIHSQQDECEHKCSSSSVRCMSGCPNIPFSISRGRGRIQLQSKLETIAETL